MNVLFRADSSSRIGTGHIMRDLVLAKQFKNDNIIFATKELKGNINFKIKEAGYRIESLKSNDFEELNKLIKKLRIDMIIVDNYYIDYTYEKQLKFKNPELKIMVLDDTYERHYCDILLNHNISADKRKYKNLVSENCEIRCGSKFTLLREEFYKEKKKLNKKVFNTKKYLPKTIFVAMGGADSYNINIKILEILKSFSNIEVKIVTTSGNKNLKKLEKYCKNKKWIDLYIDSIKIAPLISRSDFAIVTPSVIVNEIITLTIPIIAIKVTSNQEDMYQFLKKRKICVLKKENLNLLKNKVKAMIKNHKNSKKFVKGLL